MKDIDLIKSDIDDEIDKYLKKLFATKDYKLFFDRLYDHHVMNNDGGVIEQTMIERNLIRKESETRVLTSLGIEISKQGGWKSHLNKKKEKENEEIERVRQEDLKLKYDLRVSRFSAKTIVWFFIISCVSLILSIYTLLKEQIDGLVSNLFSFFK
jgi:hypothetical protein